MKFTLALLLSSLAFHRLDADLCNGPCRCYQVMGVGGARVLNCGGAVIEGKITTEDVANFHHINLKGAAFVADCAAFVSASLEVIDMRDAHGPVCRLLRNCSFLSDKVCSLSDDDDDDDIRTTKEMSTYFVHLCLCSLGADFRRRVPSARRRPLAGLVKCQCRWNRADYARCCGRLSLRLLLRRRNGSCV